MSLDAETVGQPVARKPIGDAANRFYWQPVALAEELADPRPVEALRVMGQDLVLFSR
jgi:hypothetical protein